MSFLYDVYDQILTDEVLKSISKQAQQAIPPDLPPLDQSAPAPKSNISPALSSRDVAKKLVNKLSREFSGAKEQMNIMSGTPTPIDLNVNHLQSLSKLLQFLANNKISIDGTRVAYSGNEMQSVSEEERNKLAPISVNLSRDANTRKWNVADFYTHLPSLIKYVSYLQNKSQDLKKGGDAQGKVLEVMVGKLIDSINNIKPDSGLERTPKSRPDKPNEMSGRTVIDTFGSKVFNVNDPYSDTGPIPLLAKDLVSRETLNAWLRQGPEAQISGTDNKLVKFTSPEANHCNIINVLYKRATNLARTAASPEETRKYNFYVGRLTQLGPTFTDPQGKACAIGVTEPKYTSRYNFLGQQEPGSESGAVSKQILEQVVQSMPLDTQDLDFNRIRNFFTQYSRIVSPNNVASVQSAMMEALNAMNAAQLKTATGNQQNFRFTRNVQEFQTWLKPPTPSVNYGNIALPLLHDLQTVLSATGRVLGIFYNEYVRAPYSKDRQMFDNEQRNLVEAQIVGNNSIYVQNLREIQSLMSNVQSILLGGK